MNAPSVAVVVLNWRKPAETVSCLESLSRVEWPNLHIIAVDNASGDGSPQAIRGAFPDIAVLENAANLGYAGGNNVGIRHALAGGADAVLILNNDTAVSPDFLQPLLEAALGSSEPAVVTPAICDIARREVLWALGADIDWRDASAIRLHSGESYTHWRSTAPFAVIYAAGSAMLAPRIVWEHAGLIDEDYFLYYEEADWCMVAKRAGFPVLAVPGSLVWHEVAAQDSRRSPAVTYYMTRNALRFIRRNAPDQIIRASMLRIVLKAHWHMLGDIKNLQPARAISRAQGLIDFARGRFGPRGTSSG